MQHIIPIMLVIVAAVVQSHAALPPYKHAGLNLYPAAAIQVDGSLADWPAALFVEMCADPDLKEFYALKLACAYDAQGLLLAARFTDSTPLLNRIDPKTDPFKGWCGDALQIRFITDPALAGKELSAPALNSNAIVHLTMWYYTDRGEPVMDARYGMDFHGAVTQTGEASGLRFQKAEGGYVLEGRVPWSLLKAQPPAAGRWRMTVQPLWGGAGESEAMQHSFFDVIAAGGFHFQTPGGWGYADFVKPDEVAARLAVQAAEESRIFAPPADAQPQAIVAVTYTNPVKGFVSLAICRPDDQPHVGGQIVRTLLTKAAREAGAQSEPWDGLDDDGKPVPPGEYRLKALVHDGITPRYVCSVMNSGNPGWGNKGGHYGWGGDHGNPLGAASDDDGNTYLLWEMNEGGNYLIRVDATGQKQWGADLGVGTFDGLATAVLYDEGRVYVAKDGLGQEPSRGGLFVYDAATGRIRNAGIPVTTWPKKLAAGLPGHPANLRGLAASSNRLFCALCLENQIVALDKKTMQRSATFAAPHPKGLAYDGRRGRLYAATDDGIVALDADGKAQPFVSGLDAPYGLALDKDGQVYVSVRGKQMQVRVFAPNGKLLRRIGKAGGRPAVGRFDPKGMYLPAGISVNAQGQLWVTEQDAMPKRQSLWDAKTGKLIRDFYGSTAYAPMMAPDPDEPEHVYLHNTRFIVDYEKGTWRPDATVFRTHYGGATIGGPDATVYRFMGSTFEIASFQGRKFAHCSGGVFACERDRFKPLLRPNNWEDANGDGFWSSNEIVQLSPTSKTFYAQDAAIKTMVSRVGGSGAFFPNATFLAGRRIYQPTGLSKKGVPLYPKPEDTPAVLDGDGPMKAYSNWRDIRPSSRTNWQDCYAIASLLSPKGYEDGGGADGVYRFLRNGDIRWRYSRVFVFFALQAPLAKIGDLFGAQRLVGAVQLPAERGGEIIGVSCYRGYFGFLNEDGLFVDQIGYDNGRGPAPNFDAFFIENFSGYFFQHPRTGKVYLFCGDVDGRILELQGWETIRRFDGGRVTISAAQYRDTVAAVAAAKASTAPGAAPAVLRIGATNRPPSFARIPLDETRQAEVALRYDAEKLYAVFKVPDTSPWKNSALDWRFVFKGGDAVDIQLGPPQVGPGKRKPQAGDVRLLIAPAAADQPETFQVVAMWLQAPSGMAGEPVRYQSPTGEETFGRVALLTNVVGKVETRSDGYTLEVAIPWQALRLSPPASNALLSGDAGVLQSDAGGMLTTLRRYLFNRDTGIINDIPSEVRVNTALWGTLHFE